MSTRYFTLLASMVLAGTAQAGSQSSNTSSNSSSNNSIVRERIADTYCRGGYCQGYVQRRVYRDGPRARRYGDPYPRHRRDRYSDDD